MDNIREIVTSNDRVIERLSELEGDRWQYDDTTVILLRQLKIVIVDDHFIDEYDKGVVVRDGDLHLLLGDTCYFFIPSEGYLISRDRGVRSVIWSEYCDRVEVTPELQYLFSKYNEIERDLYSTKNLINTLSMCCYFKFNGDVIDTIDKEIVIDNDYESSSDEELGDLLNTVRTGITGASIMKDGMSIQAIRDKILTTIECSSRSDLVDNLIKLHSSIDRTIRETITNGVLYCNERCLGFIQEGIVHLDVITKIVVVDRDEDRFFTTSNGLSGSVILLENSYLLTAIEDKKIVYITRTDDGETITNEITKSDDLNRQELSLYREYLTSIINYKPLTIDNTVGYNSLPRLMSGYHLRDNNKDCIIQ